MNRSNETLYLWLAGFSGTAIGFAAALAWWLVFGEVSRG